MVCKICLLVCKGLVLLMYLEKLMNVCVSMMIVGIPMKIELWYVSVCMCVCVCVCACVHVYVYVRMPPLKIS